LFLFTDIDLFTERFFWSWLVSSAVGSLTVVVCLLSCQMKSP